jgi:hypothetical protein
MCVCMWVCVCVTGGCLEKVAPNGCTISFTLLILLRQEGWTGRDIWNGLFEMRYVFKVLFRKHEGKDLFGKPRHR